MILNHQTLNFNHLFNKNPTLRILPNSLPSTLTQKSQRRSLFSFRKSSHQCFLPVSASQNPSSNSNPKRRGRPKKNSNEKIETEANPSLKFLKTVPRKPRRGRRSETVAVEDFVRGSLERTFVEIRKQISSIPSDEVILKLVDKGKEEQGAGVGERVEEEKKKKVEEEEEEGEVGDVLDAEDPNWPLDADVGWGIRASEFFGKYPIRNVVDENGVEVDWEGEMEAPWVKEINCLEWENFAFHPSPLIVLVFERYNRIADNWMAIKELEKAARVYWNAKDRLPPRTVKIDINIERDLAYALKVRECPQLLFLHGNRILYREKDLRTADELVQMIAFFYYHARKPSWVDDKAIAWPY